MSDRQSEDPSSIPGGAALCFFRLIQLSVHICRIEKEKKFDFDGMVPTGTYFRFETMPVSLRGYIIFTRRATFQAQPAGFQKNGHAYDSHQNTWCMTDGHAHDNHQNTSCMTVKLTTLKI